jgi:hypothetical protein
MAVEGIMSLRSPTTYLGRGLAGLLSVSLGIPTSGTGLANADPCPQ